MLRDEPRPYRKPGRWAGLGAALTFCLLDLPTAHADDTVLGKLAGAWIGSGTVQLSARAKPEKIYCKIDGTVVGGKAIEQKGRCSIGNGSGSLVITIGSRGGASYGGKMTAPSMGSADLAGRRSGDRLELVASFFDKKTGSPREATVTMHVATGVYRLTMSSAGEDGRYVASDIVFKKK